MAGAGLPVIHHSNPEWNSVLHNAPGIVLSCAIAPVPGIAEIRDATRYNAVMKKYSDIFQVRGQEHAEAFRRYPDSVREEVNAILQLAAPQPGEVVLDLPAASGFLSRYMDVPGARLLAVEPSNQLYELCKQAVENSYMAPLDCLPLQDEQVDVAICLAGLHHEQRLADIFAEVFRVLRVTGRFAIAEVNENSGPACFLNGFVNQHSSLGHSGLFASPAYRELLEAVGFRVVTDQEVQYHWRFSSAADMADCLKLMFGIDRANPDQIIAAVADVLGMDELPDGSVGMRWSLLHLLGHKPQRDC